MALRKCFNIALIALMASAIAGCSHKQDTGGATPIYSGTPPTAAQQASEQAKRNQADQAFAARRAAGQQAATRGQAAH